MDPFFSNIFKTENPAPEFPNSLHPSNVEDVHTTVLFVIIGILLFFLFYIILDGSDELIQNSGAHNDLELGEMGEMNHSQVRNGRANVDWSLQATAAVHRRNVWMLETLNRFIHALDERRGLRREEVEKVLPLVNYKSSEMKWGSDDCVICLEDFEDEDLCRMFPVCSHVFHLECIDSWVKNHRTCPVCRNCILDLDLDSL